MSLRRYNKIAFFAAKEAAVLVGTKVTKYMPINFVKLIQRIPFFKMNIAITKRAMTKTFQRTVRNPKLFYARPFAALHHVQRHRLHVNTRANQTTYVFVDEKSLDIFQRVKRLFGTNACYNKGLNSFEMPNNLSGYEIGNHIACGCNAAVYALRVRDDVDRATTHYENFSLNASACPTVKTFPLALKMMFNYDFSLPESCLWMEMGPEVIPLRKVPRIALKGRMADFNFFAKAHPNLIEMHTAFVDSMPILPDSEILYPEALPNFNYFETLIHNPKTLFIVMKRYKMTLRDYILTHKRNYWTGKVMFAQLLEALVFLYDHRISHRDIKSDNVLLDFDHEDEVPHLVLSDFGSALVSDNFCVAYDTENTDLGGNVSLRAPEIRRARCGSGVILDFSMADTWSVATIAYEIFMRLNPFYSSLNSESYMEADILPLPKNVHYAIKNVCYDMLRIDPNQRPKPEVAANVLSLSLFRFKQDLRLFFRQLDSKKLDVGISRLCTTANTTLSALTNKLERKLDMFIELYSIETILSKFLNPAVISSAELQLRATFLSRINRDEVAQAMSYNLTDHLDNFTNDVVTDNPVS